VTIEGEYKTFGSLGSEGSHVNRGFCPNCGSQMFTFVDEIPGQLFIKAGGMEDTSWLSVETTCWTSTARDWLPADTNTAGFEKNPELAG
ncbi:MAG: GFA family protein, partial [Halieaceae bacterium]